MITHLLLIVSLLIHALVSLSLLPAHLQADIKVGGFSQPTIVNDESTLTGQMKQFNQFIRNNIAEVQGKSLLSYRIQVVAGQKICNVYGTRQGGNVSNTVQVCLWSKPWEQGFLQLNEPNGRKITVNRDQIQWPIQKN